MVDVSAKQESQRVAVAQSIVLLPSEIISQLENDEIHTKKGPVFQTAVLAGIMAAKKTSELIPLCHPLPLSKCAVDINLDKKGQIVIDCMAKTVGQTGVEMEAFDGSNRSRTHHL